MSGAGSRTGSDRIAELVAALDLAPHPEGGYFAQSYRAVESVQAEHLPARFGGARALSTAIYYLLPSGAFSRLHRLKADEVWHFYEGSPLALEVLDPSGRHRTLRLGPNLAAGETFQAVVPAGCWFGASVAGADSYALVGCTVAPGFEFADFELGERQRLLDLFPHERSLIDRLCP